MRSKWKQSRERSSSVLVVFSLTMFAWASGRFCPFLPECTGTSNAPEKVLYRNFVPVNVYQCSCQGQKDTYLSAFLSAFYAVYTSLSYQLWISGFIRFNGALSLPLWCQHFSSVSSQAAVSLLAIVPRNFLTLIIRPASITDAYRGSGTGASYIRLISVLCSLSCVVPHTPLNLLIVNNVEIRTVLLQIFLNYESFYGAVDSCGSPCPSAYRDISACAILKSVEETPLWFGIAKCRYEVQRTSECPVTLGFWYRLSEGWRCWEGAEHPPKLPHYLCCQPHAIPGWGRQWAAAGLFYFHLQGDWNGLYLCWWQALDMGWREPLCIMVKIIVSG